MNIDEIIVKLQDAKARILKELNVKDDGELLELEDKAGLCFRTVSIRIPENAHSEECLQFESIHFEMDDDGPHVAVEAGII